MEKYNYLAVDKSNRKYKGVVEAVGLIQAQSILRSKKLFIVHLDKVQIVPGWLLWLQNLNRVKKNDVVNFTQQLSTMVSAGLPLTNTLAILKYQSSPGMGRIIDEILREVEGGGTFSKALQRYDRIFDKVYLSLVQSGEKAGVLEKVLIRLASNLEKQSEFRGKTKSALIYPVIVVVAMLIVVTIMMIFVVPKLTSLFSDMGASLPVITKILISTSTFMVKTIPFWLLALVGGGYFFTRWRKTPSGGLFYDTHILRVPLIGPLKTKIILSEVTRTLALLLESGVSVVEALEIVSGVADNELFSRSLITASKDVEKGIPLAAAIGQFEHFPPLISQMISVGEETGKIDEVMFKVSHYFETESEQEVKGLTTAIEPLMMIVLGVGVCFLVMAIIMPIYNLTSQF